MNVCRLKRPWVPAAVETREREPVEQRKSGLLDEVKSLGEV